jgi:AhpD family alkylhydroperoxidase
MKLDNHTLALIAVGASVAANCQPCLERNYSTALQCGADAQEIAEAIEVGKRVRHGAAVKMDKFAIGLDSASLYTTRAADSPCECSSSAAFTGGDNG